MNHSIGCLKCGRKVPLGNDAIALGRIVACMERRGVIDDNALNCFECQTVCVSANSQHLLPLIERGRTVCLGSPSRAQYLEGQPRDARPEYAYNPAYETVFRAAYQRLQRMVAPSIR